MRGVRGGGRGRETGSFAASRRESSTGEDSDPTGGSITIRSVSVTRIAIIYIVILMLPLFITINLAHAILLLVLLVGEKKKL